MNKREVMKVENLVRNYKMVYSDRQGEEEIKVLKGLDFTGICRDHGKIRLR